MPSSAALTLTEYFSAICGSDPRRRFPDRSTYGVKRGASGGASDPRRRFPARSTYRVESTDLGTDCSGAIAADSRPALPIGWKLRLAVRLARGPLPPIPGYHLPLYTRVKRLQKKNARVGLDLIGFPATCCFSICSERVKYFVSLRQQYNQTPWQSLPERGRSSSAPQTCRLFAYPLASQRAA